MKYNPYVNYHGDYNYGGSLQNNKLYIKHRDENKKYYDHLRSKIRSSASEERNVTKVE